MEQYRTTWGEVRAHRRSILQSFGVAAIGLSLGGLTGCGGSAGGNGSAGAADAGGGGTAALPERIADTGEAKALNFYNWDTYIGETTLDDFKAASDIPVNMSIFANNDELFAKLRAGNPGYDVIVPSNNFVERMAQAKMIQPLDHALIPNMKNIDPEFLNPTYDPGRKYSMPYTWLVVGIGYRKSAVKPAPDSWKLLLDSDQYKGRIALASEAGDLFRIYGKYLGISVNALTPADVQKIEAMMIRQKPFIKTFHEDNGQDLLLSGEVDLVMEYNGDIAQKMDQDPDIDFVVPVEGSEFTSDTLCIPTGAPHPKNAHAFINYLLDAEVGRRITETIKYPTPNIAARKLMPPSYASNPVIFPPKDRLAKCEYDVYRPDMQPLYEEAFTRVRAA